MAKKLYQDDPIDFTSFEDLKKYKQNQKVRFVCTRCGETDIKYAVYLSEPLLCKKCKRKDFIDRFDFEARNKKSEATKLERYGDPHYTNVQKIMATLSKKTKEEKDEIYNKVRSTNLERYGGHPASRQEQKDRTKQTCIEKYGVVSPGLSQDVKKKIEQTNLEIYGVKNVFANEDIKNKIKKTNIERYGVENPRKSKFIDNKIKKTCIERYGAECSFSNHDIRVKCQQSYNYRNIFFDSSWELAYYIYLTDHDIDFQYQPDYFFEFLGKRYYPDFKVNGKFQEIKGEHFFDGDKMVNPYDRSKEQDKIYEAKHQCMIHNGVDILRYEQMKPILDYIYKTYSKHYLKLFKTDIEFPYPNEDFKDKSLDGPIKNFHKSIYHANRKVFKAPYDAFKDPLLIEKSAINRLKYVGSCKPSDIVYGFNVSKIAPKVSVFSPVVAKNLIERYLKEYDTVFDPFSGFSGRMIGTELCGKKYIGSDINEAHVKESNDIIDYMNYHNSSVITHNIFEYENTSYECLFTCPPYSDKENWNGDADVDKTCDEWIDICIEKFKCKAYLFVVDDTHKYKKFIVDTIENKSHLGTNFEKVILIK